MSDEKKSNAPAEKTVNKFKFKVFDKGTKEFEHHLLKLLPAQMKRNTSWKFEQPNIVTLEHCHIFHSLNDKTFQPNKHCTPVGGHTHEVELVFGTDADGNRVVVDAKCGPPMHHVAKHVGGGRRVKVLEQVGWDGFDERGNRVRIMDNHKHDFEYHGREMMTQHGQQAYRNAARAEVVRSQDGPPSKQAAALNNLENGPGKDEVRGNLKDATGQFPHDPNAQG